MDTLKYSIDSLITIVNNNFQKDDSISNVIQNNQENILNTLLKLDKSDDFKSILMLIVGAIIGLLLSLLWNFIKNQCLYSKYRKYYSKYEGLYLAYNKYDLKKENLFRCFELVRNKNKFIIRTGISTLGHEDFDAEITMNENNWDYGKGYYQHNRSPDGITRFGFLEIQLADPNILVHETIYNKKGEQNSDAYRWIKQFPSNKEEFIDEYRQIQIIKRQEKFAKFLNKDE